MCGIVGVVGRSSVGLELYEGLSMMQHRGQDAAGIVTCAGDRLTLRKANGLVRDVFGQSHISALEGSMGIGHVRYPTAGTSSTAEAQPMYVNSPFGICMAHNGNLINADDRLQWDVASLHARKLGLELLFSRIYQNRRAFPKQHLLNFHEPPHIALINMLGINLKDLFTVVKNDFVDRLVRHSAHVVPMWARDATTFAKIRKACGEANSLCTTV